MFLPDAPAKDFGLYSFPSTLIVPLMSYAKTRKRKRVSAIVVLAQQFQDDTGRRFFIRRKFSDPHGTRYQNSFSPGTEQFQNDTKSVIFGGLSPKDCNVSLILTLSTYIPISQLEDREW
jgi:hypothetical protein